jgi:hypothetical protein
MKGGTEMPAGVRHLLTTGHLMARECDELGVHVMLCVHCQGPVDLIARFKPIPEAKLRQKRVLPAMVWGKDVTVICRCCSFDKCPHKVHP